MSIEVRDVSRFDKVRFRGPGILKINQAEEESLTIHAPAYVMTDVISEVVDGVLVLGYRSPKVTPLRVLKEVISYDLSMRDIRKISVNGSGSVVVPDLDNDAVTIELTGSGKVNLEHLTADRLRTTIHGSGLVRVVGDVENQALTLNGSGRYDAEYMVSDFAQLTVNGSGNVGVSVTDDLQVVINGSGKVTYSGFPDISKAISGSGSLTRRRREKRSQDRGEDHG